MLVQLVLIGLFWSFLVQPLVATMLKICIFNFFYWHISIVIFNQCVITLGYMYNDKVFPIFWTQNPFIFQFSLCKWGVIFWHCSYRRYTPGRCVKEMPLEGHQLSSFYFAVKTEWTCFNWIFIAGCKLGNSLLIWLMVVILVMIDGCHVLYTNFLNAVQMCERSKGFLPHFNLLIHH